MSEERVAMGDYMTKCAQICRKNVLDFIIKS